MRKSLYEITKKKNNYIKQLRRNYKKNKKINKLRKSYD